MEKKWIGKCQKCGKEETTNRHIKNMTKPEYSREDGYYFSWEKCPRCGAGHEDLGWWGGMLFQSTFGLNKF